MKFPKKKRRKKRQYEKGLKGYKTPKVLEMDGEYKTRFSMRSLMNKLPEMVIKTRKNAYKFKNKIFAPNKTEFPKPFKLEDENSLEDYNTPIELPKPKKIKTELNLNAGNAQCYLRPRFQPIVRLKRLKNEELLVPRHATRTHQFKGTKDFLIEKVYSLNPRIRLKRLNIDYDHSYYNEEHLLNSSLATSSDNSNNMQNESFVEMEFKYFTPVQRFSLFESSTPDRSSLLSNPADSGVSSSMPSTSHHNCVEDRFYLPEVLENQNSLTSNNQTSIDYTDRTSTTTSLHYHPNTNNTLLLEIAAERAFINNHLMHFGYSPVQFDLFNNPSELTIFLKFLFGNVNLN